MIEVKFMFSDILKIQEYLTMTKYPIYAQDKNCLFAMIEL